MVKILASITSIFLSLLVSTALAVEKPNIVLVFMDNFGWGARGKI